MPRKVTVTKGPERRKASLEILFFIKGVYGPESEITLKVNPFIQLTDEDFDRFAKGLEDAEVTVRKVYV